MKKFGLLNGNSLLITDDAKAKLLLKCDPHQGSLFEEKNFTQHSIEKFNNAELCGGLLKVSLQGENGLVLFGVCDWRLEEVLPLHYECIDVLEKIILAYKGEDFLIFDVTGELLLECEKLIMSSSEYMLVEEYGRKHLISYEGKKLEMFEDAKIVDVEDYLIVFEKNKKFILFDMAQAKYVSPYYDNFNPDFWKRGINALYNNQTAKKE